MTAHPVKNGMLDDGPTLDQIKKWPAAVSVPLAGRALGYSTSWSYQLAAQGDFPCKVITVGNRHRVVTASLIKLLEADEEDA